MKSTNQAQIRQVFTQQAAGFESARMNFSKQNYLDYAVRKIAPTKDDAVLEVAAGTCACGRAIAPYAGSVVCLDMTPAMLSVGKTEAERAGLRNMAFVLGDAAELPFLDGGFDIVFSRLAFHHFPDTRPPFAEMVRILKPGGKLILIDMEAAEEPLREAEDAIEKLRDPSHVRNLSKVEMLALYQAHGLSVTCHEVVRLPVVLQNWLDHAKTPPDMQSCIKDKMLQELHGDEKTGFSPYLRNGELCFDHRWVLTVGISK